MLRHKFTNKQVQFSNSRQVDSTNNAQREFFVDNTHETWIEHLKTIDLPGSCMVIEITECLLLEDRPEIAGKLQQFRNAGIQISLEHFRHGVFVPWPT